MDETRGLTLAQLQFLTHRCCSYAGSIAAFVELTAKGFRKSWGDCFLRTGWQGSKFARQSPVGSWDSWSLALGGTLQTFAALWQTDQSLKQGLWVSSKAAKAHATQAFVSQSRATKSKRGIWWKIMAMVLMWPKKPARSMEIRICDLNYAVSDHWLKIIF